MCAKTALFRATRSHVASIGSKTKKILSVGSIRSFRGTESNRRIGSSTGGLWRHFVRPAAGSQFSVPRYTRLGETASLDKADRSNQNKVDLKGGEVLSGSIRGVIPDWPDNSVAADVTNRTVEGVSGAPDLCVSKLVPCNGFLNILLAFRVELYKFATEQIQLAFSQGLDVPFSTKYSQTMSIDLVDAFSRNK